MHDVCKNLVLIINFCVICEFSRDDYQKYKAAGRLIPDGSNVQWLSSRGPLSRLIGKNPRKEGRN